jgi:hypothetical protein
MPEMTQKRESVPVSIYLSPEVHSKVLEQMEAFNQSKSSTIELILMQAFGMAPGVDEQIRAIKARSSR